MEASFSMFIGFFCREETLVDLLQRGVRKSMCRLSQSVFMLSFE